MTTTIKTMVNGGVRELEVPERMLLGDLLRERLGLTGTKLSCGMQVCGVCTVLVDGQPVSSCTYLAVDVDGREVETVEGLAADGELNPIQQAFVDAFGLQCGFCTPGFIMSAKALLDRVPDPSREEIAHELEGNICRCTGYEPIVDAVELAAQRIREARHDG